MAVDSSGNGNTGTTGGSPVWTGSGKIGNALTFPANNQYVDAGNPASLQITGSLTMTAWIYATSITPSDGDDVIMHKNSWAGSSQGYQLKGSQDCTGVDPQDNLVLMIAPTSSTYLELCSKTVLLTNTWYFVAGVYDAAARAMHVYINGALDDGAWSYNGSSSVPSSINNSPVNFNIDLNDATGGGLHGTIDDARIYNRALSTAEVAQLYNAGQPATPGDMRYNSDSHVMQYCNGAHWLAMGKTPAPMNGLVGWWKLDDGTGTSAADSSGTGNTGTLTNGPTWTGGMNNGSVSFDGTNDFIDISNESNFDFEYTHPFSISAWVYRTSMTGEDAIVAKQGPATQHAGYFFELTPSSNCFAGCAVFGIASDTNASLQSYIFSYNGATPLNTWLHMVATYNGNGLMSGVHIYVNGVDQTDQAGPYNGLGANSILNNTDVHIGVVDAALNDPFHGNIDDVRIYNRALSATEVSNLYYATGGTAGDTTTGLVGWWKMDDGSGTSVADSSSNGYTGTLNGSPTPVWAAAGKINGALQFDGSSGQSVNFGNPSFSFDVNTPFSISAWVYRTSDTTADYIFTRGNGVPGYSLELDRPSGCDGCVVFRLGATTTHSAVYSTVSSVTTGVWHHIVASYDGSGSCGSADAHIYIDGQDATGFCAGGNPAGTMVPNGNASVGTGSAGTNMIVDDLRIYNRVLSATDVAALYNQATCAGPAGNERDMIYNTDYHVMQYCDGKHWQPMGKVPGAGGAGCSNPSGVQGDMIYNKDHSAMTYCDGATWRSIGGPTEGTTSGLVGWWKLDETSGTAAADSSGSANTGTLQNAPAWTTGGMDNGALTLNGTNQYVDVGNASTLNFERTQPFSVSAWIYPLASGSGYEPIVSKRDYSGTFQGIEFDDDMGCFCLFATLFGTGGSSGLQVYGSTSISFSAWHHVVMTYDGTSSSASVKLYLDGVSETVSVPWNDLASSILNSANMTIGTKPSSGSYFTGTVDDVRIYNRALNAGEIWTLYKATGG